MLYINFLSKVTELILTQVYIMSRVTLTAHTLKNVFRRRLLYQYTDMDK